MRTMSTIKIIVSIFFCLWLTACSAPAVRGIPVSDLPASAMTSQPRIADRFVIAPGDELGVKFYYNPELNEEVVVRPDGRISLQLVPEVMAAGRTPAQLGEALNQSYAAEVDRERIAVIVRSISPRQVFVDGEVTKPGILNFTNPISVMQAMAFAEGSTDRALLNQVLIIRRLENQAPLVIQANLDLALDGTDLSQDIKLLQNDVIYVPRKPISDVDIWVDQYIRQLIPFPFVIGTR